MSYEEDLLNLVRREIERFHASRYSERHGLVTSYDPKTHLAKVAFQPEGQESGWLPVETGHMGNGWGILIGLTPGQAGSSSGSSGSSGGSSNNTGDQVIVRYQEGDFESGKIVQRVHSDQDKPPTVQAGEMLFQHKLGAKVFLDQNGKITITDKTGNSSLVMDGNGNITISAGSSGTMTVNANTFNLNAPTITLKGNVALGGTGGKPLAIQGTIDTAGNADISNLATKVTAV